MTDREAEAVIERLWQGAWLRVVLWGDYPFGDGASVEIWRVKDGFDEVRETHWEDASRPGSHQRWHWTRDQVKASVLELDYETVLAALAQPPTVR